MRFGFSHSSGWVDGFGLYIHIQTHDFYDHDTHTIHTVRVPAHARARLHPAGPPQDTRGDCDGEHQNPALPVSESDDDGRVMFVYR